MAKHDPMETHPPLTECYDVEDNPITHPLVVALQANNGKMTALKVVESFQDDHEICFCINSTVGEKEYYWSAWWLSLECQKDIFKAEDSQEARDKLVIQYIYEQAKDV